MTPTAIIAALYGTGLFVWLFWPALSQGWAWLTSKSVEPQPESTKWIIAAETIDLADLRALKQIETRFRRLNCEAGLAACQTLYANFFHRGGPEA